MTFEAPPRFRFHRFTKIRLALLALGVAGCGQGSGVAEPLPGAGSPAVDAVVLSPGEVLGWVDNYYRGAQTVTFEFDDSVASAEGHIDGSSVLVHRRGWMYRMDETIPWHSVVASDGERWIVDDTVTHEEYWTAQARSWPAASYERPFSLLTAEVSLARDYLTSMAPDRPGPPDTVCVRMVPRGTDYWTDEAWVYVSTATATRGALVRLEYAPRDAPDHLHSTTVRLATLRLNAEVDDSLFRYSLGPSAVDVTDLRSRGIITPGQEASAAWYGAN